MSVFAWLENAISATLVQWPLFPRKMYYCLPGEPAAWEDNSLLLKMQGDTTFKMAFCLFTGEEGSKVWAL